MMTERALLNRLKLSFSAPSWTIGKLDQTKEQTVCVYGGVTPDSAVQTIGHFSGYYTKRFKFVLRWGKNSDEAQIQAWKLYNVLRNMRTTIIEGAQSSVLMIYSEPIPLGTDEKGVYEYMIEIRMFCER